MSAGTEPTPGSEPTLRKLHPSSIAVRSLSRSVNLGFLFFVFGVFASPGSPGANLVVIFGMVLVGIAFGVVYEIAYYQRFRYELTDDTFDVSSGVLSRRDREVPFRRIQNVDIRQNVIGRLLGIAAVHVESAGGGQTEITLEYVDEAEAKRLQRQLRRGSRADPAAESDADEDDDEEETLFELETNELVILSVFTIDPGASILGGIALSFASGFDPTTLVPVGVADVPGTGLIALAWIVVVFLLAAWVLSAALTFTRYYGFRLTRVGDELHYERGLIQRYSGTIPLEKVQTLTITESVPFRWFGYAALAVETAGYAPGQSGTRGTESAIPLADRDRVHSLARSIEPFGPVDLEPIPKRARERYAIRYAGVVAVLVGLAYLFATYTGIVSEWYVAAALVLAVPVVAHLTWRSRGYRVGDRYFFARTGVWRRSTKIVPYYRVQAVVNAQTIFQRRRRLAHVTADTASSASLLGRAATALDIDAARALEVQRDVEARLQEQLRARMRERTVAQWFDETARDDEPAGPAESDRSPSGTGAADSRERSDRDNADGSTSATEPGDGDDAGEFRSSGDAAESTSNGDADGSDEDADGPAERDRRE